MQDTLHTLLIAERDARVKTAVPIELTHPEPQFGDWTTNLALRIAKELEVNPRTLAQEMANSVSEKLGNDFTVEVAGPGFINITLPEKVFCEAVSNIIVQPKVYGTNSMHAGKRIIVEGTDPNPFKQLHIGHMYSNTVGEAIAGLYEASGAEVIRANYQGDVGMHVAMSIWGMMKQLDGAPMGSIPKEERVTFLGSSYAKGATAFREDTSAKAEITRLNKLIYKKDPEVKDLYETGRRWSLDYFETQYKRLQTHFDAYYFEQFTGEKGMEIIEKHRDIFSESDGALVYEGEQDGLHTRVFVNSQGFPTYEAKDLGLTAMKEHDHAPDISITFTGNEIIEYFKVIKAVLAKINPQWAEKMQHIPHGMVRLPEGKMSSRTGDVITAEWVLDTTEAMIKKANPEAKAVTENTLGAIKYAFLKHRIGGNIAFDMAESISLEGNSGPYIQYAHARARRVLTKLESPLATKAPSNLKDSERELARLLTKLPEVILQATQEHSPHTLCSYLYSVAQMFNRFYEHNRIIDDEREQTRAQLTAATATVLQNGLRVLNIPAPESM